jgi:hypothetical protein
MAGILAQNVRWSSFDDGKQPGGPELSQLSALNFYAAPLRCRDD